MDAITPAATLEALLEQGRLAEARGQLQVARDLYERGLHALTPGVPAGTIAQLLLGVGRTHLDGGNTGAALDCVEAVLALPDEAGMAVAEAQALELRGRIRWRDGELEAAAEEFAQARAVGIAAGRPELAALAARRLAALALLRGDLAEAAALDEAALSSFRAAGDEAAATETLASLAALYMEMKRWNAAEQAFAEASAWAGSRHDDRLSAHIELGRAYMALDRANAERAQVSAERALDLARRLDDPALTARALLACGVVARERGDPARAERLLDQAARHATELDDLLLSAECALEEADLLARSERHADALVALNRVYRALVQLSGVNQDADATRRARRLDDGFMEVVRRWAQRIEAKDHATAGHCDRVADLTCEIARRMGVERRALRWYRVGAYLHDMGKLEIPAAILNKAGRLSPEEWAVVKRHPIAGAEMLRSVDFPWEVRPIVESHHECWDGSGYPHGLAYEEIPLAARIFTVADVYDALVSRRPFKAPLAHQEALEAMRRDVGRQFDPAVFRVFEEVVRDGVPIPGVTSAAALPARADVRDVPLLDDALTAVADRASWMQRAAAVLAARRTSDHPVSVLLLDVDHFSRVNTTYGRLQGDDVLWAVAKVLQRGLRTGDLIGRRGGDEFVILLPSTMPPVALEVAERLRRGCGELRCARRDAPEESIAISVSVAVASAPQDGETVEALLAAADRALYRAKRDGRDRVVVADQADAASARARLDFDAFVAREEELRTLVSLLDLAARGDARLVTIAGEEGIGKTALVRHLEPEVRLRAGTVITAQCLDGDQHAAYAPWTDILSQLHARGALAREGWRVLPQLLPDLPMVGDDDAWALTPSIVQEEVVRAVRRAARERLLVLVFEDAQWADAASWAVLEALLPALDGERLFVVLTLRPEEARAAAEHRRRLAQHARVSTLSLRRFSEEELRRWTQVVFRDADPGHEFPRLLYDYTEGIPLHVVQVLHALADAGGIWYGGTRWEWRPLAGPTLPPGVAFVLERRLARLSPGARQVLSTAAVLGEPFAVELLLATSNVPEEQVTGALDEGIAAGVVVRESAGRDAYRFAHPLLVEAITRDVPERQRQRVHEVAARLMELREPSSVAAIAGHYHAAGLDAEAHRYALTAAERSASVFAHDAALEALQVAQRYAPSARDLAALRVRLSATAHEAGHYAAAEGWCDLALAWLEGEGRGARDGGVSLVRTLRERVRVQRGKSPARAVDALRAVLAATPPGEPAARAEVQLAAAALAAVEADWPRTATLARKALEALDASVALPDEEAPHSTATGGGAGEAGEPGDPGDGPGALPLMPVPVSARRAEAQRLLALARYAVAPADAMALAREGIGMAAGHRVAAAQVRATLGELYLRAGHATHAEEALGEALDAARGAHAAPLAATVSRALGELRARQGNASEAAQWLGDAERIFTALGDVPELLRTVLVAAHVARDHGERARAHALYERAAGEARTLEIAWIELAALAGAVLTNGGPLAPSAWAAWSRANELIASAPGDWWFAGRELVDAVTLQMALGAGHSGAAVDLFARALRRLDAVDPYAGAWLVAECAPALEVAGLPAMRVARRQAADRARTLAFAPLVARLESA